MTAVTETLTPEHAATICQRVGEAWHAAATYDHLTGAHGCDFTPLEDCEDADAIEFAKQDGRELIGFLDGEYVNDDAVYADETPEGFAQRCADTYSDPFDGEDPDPEPWVPEIDLTAVA